MSGMQLENADAHSRPPPVASQLLLFRLWSSPRSHVQQRRSLLGVGEIDAHRRIAQRSVIELIQRAATQHRRSESERMISCG